MKVFNLTDKSALLQFNSDKNLAELRGIRFMDFISEIRNTNELFDEESKTGS